MRIERLGVGALAAWILIATAPATPAAGGPAAVPVPAAPAPDTPPVPGSAAAPAPAPPAFDHSEWNFLLRISVRDGRVDYRSLLVNRPRLDLYLSRVAEANPRGWSDDEQMAFWINAYNARMVASVLDAWPVESVLDIGRLIGLVPTAAVFRAKHRVAGLDRSLDDIEHRVLRGRWKDPRIHAAVNCASRSCPVLQPWAYDPARLDAQLDAVMREFVYDPRRNRVFLDPPQLSSIFKWYRDDFEREAGSVWGYVRSVLDPEDRSRVPERARPGFLSYDWALNGR